MKKIKKILALSMVVLLIFTGFSCVSTHGDEDSIFIEGFVYNLLGKPLYWADAYVRITHPGGSYGMGTSTDENGYFKFTVDKKYISETCTLTTSILNVSKSIEFEITFDIPLFEIILPIAVIPNSTLCGYIRDFAQKPITGVDIYEKRRDLKTSSDENGFYCFNNVTPGKTIISFWAPGYKTGEYHSGIIPGDLIRWRNYTFATIGDEPGGINGTIRDLQTGEPIENVEIMIFVNGEFQTIFSNNKGYYEFLDLPSNQKYLLIGYTDGYMIIYSLEEVSSNVTTLANFELDYLVKYTVMAGFLYDNEGNPIDDAMFGFYFPNGGYSKCSTDKGGYMKGYFWYFPWPDIFHVKIIKEGYQSLEDYIKLPNPGIVIRHYMLTKNWTLKTGTGKIQSFAGKTFNDNITIESPNGSILTNIDFKINWKDYITYGIFKKKGLDTLTAEITHNNITLGDSSKGLGESSFSFEIHDVPVEESIVFDKNKASFDVKIQVETGERWWRPLLFLLDRGNWFTLEYKYYYYVNTN